MPSEMTLTTRDERLRRDFGVRSLLCEGGPTLFGSLLGEGLVDELFLTLAPKLAGGRGGPTISSGTELSEPRTLTLLWLPDVTESLFLRYKLRGHTSFDSRHLGMGQSTHEHACRSSDGPADSRRDQRLTEARSARWRSSRGRFPRRPRTGPFDADEPTRAGPGTHRGVRGLWLVHRYGGRPLLREGFLAEVYDAFETPRANRGDSPSFDREARELISTPSVPHARHARGAR